MTKMCLLFFYVSVRYIYLILFLIFINIKRIIMYFLKYLSVTKNYPIFFVVERNIMYMLMSYIPYSYLRLVK